MKNYAAQDEDKILNRQMNNPEWISHVSDHIIFLRRNSVKLELPDAVFYPNMARPKILLAKAGIENKHIYTILLLNNIPLVTGFTEYNRIILVPSESAFDKLEASFSDSQSF